MPRKSSALNNLKRSPFNVREAVGSNIKRCRLALGWSQQELADSFGVSRAAVSQYEIGTGEVNAGDLPRLADLLGISLLDFYDGQPPDLRPIDRHPAQNAGGNWAVEAADAPLRANEIRVNEIRVNEIKANEMKMHEPLPFQQRGRPRDTRHRRPASLEPASGRGERGLLGEVDIAEEIREPTRDAETKAREEVQREEARATDPESMNDSESGSGGSAGPLFVRDHHFRVARRIVPALDQDRSREAVARLAELAGDFLSLSRRDQETLSRVAEALRAQAQQGQMEGFDFK